MPHLCKNVSHPYKSMLTYVKVCSTMDICLCYTNAYLIHVNAPTVFVNLCTPMHMSTSPIWMYAHLYTYIPITEGLSHSKVSLNPNKENKICHNTQKKRLGDTVLKFLPPRSRAAKLWPLLSVMSNWYIPGSAKGISALLVPTVFIFCKIRNIQNIKFISFSLISSMGDYMQFKTI